MSENHVPATFNQSKAAINSLLFLLGDSLVFLWNDCCLTQNRRIGIAFRADVSRPVVDALVEKNQEIQSRPTGMPGKRSSLADRSITRSA